jgi:pyridoxal phosphate enzyme (YggS family)
LKVGTIAERIAAIRQTLPATVRLIAVTKQVSVAAMREAYAVGVRDFGESRVQEAEAKQAELKDLPDLTWHLIGHLQANKVQRAVQLFEWIHAIDSLKLAERVNRLAQKQGVRPNLCLQVKLLPDPNKYGWSISQLMADLPHLDRLEQVAIQGLMTIPPVELDHNELLEFFQQARDLSQQINQQPLSRIRIEQLSMGMSNDYPLAVQAGATMIRLGRVLFGDRETNPPNNFENSALPTDDPQSV